MDGLMIDTERLYFQTQREIAESYGKDVKKETLWKCMGKKPIESIRIFIKDLEIDAKPEDILEKRDRMMLQKMKTDLDPMPGLFEILKEYQGKLFLAIATGAIKPFVDVMMEKFQLQSCFKTIQTSEELANGKPDPEVYIRTINKMGLKPDECIVLEDSSNGALASKKAGCYTIAVPSEYTEEQDFSFADFIAGSLLSASEHIKNLVSR